MSSIIILQSDQFSRSFASFDRIERQFEKTRITSCSITKSDSCQYINTHNQNVIYGTNNLLKNTRQKRCLCGINKGMETKW